MRIILWAKSEFETQLTLCKLGDFVPLWQFLKQAALPPIRRDSAKWQEY